MVLEWTPEEASLLQDQPSLLQCQSTSHGNMGDSEPPDISYETCACIIHTINLQLHVETLHDQLPQRLQTTSYWVPEDQGTGVMISQCMKLVLLSFTLIYSATCGIVISHYCLRGVHVPLVIKEIVAALCVEADILDYVCSIVK